MADLDVSMEDCIPEEAFDDGEVDHAAHEKLLKSIYALDGKKRFQNEVRGTPAPAGNLDLVVYTKKEKAKIQLGDLEVKKRNATFTLDKPMGELETEKARRRIAQDLVTKDVAKWDPIMTEIRQAPQIKYSDRPKGMEMYEAMKPKKFAPRTPLEMEIFEALGKSEDQIQPDQELTLAERNALKAMSIKEARERRKELMKHHELLFRMDIKAKRVKKIKSKSFRKFVRKDRIAEEKKKLEDMQKNDPEAFMEKMEQLERDRMEERLTLKHRGGGKYARTHKAYSKFDTKTREAVQEMLQKSRELTKKRQTTESSDEEDENEDITMANTENVVRSIADAADDDVDESDPKDRKSSSRPSDLNSKHLEILKAVNKKAGGWLDGTTTFVYTDNLKPTADHSHKEVDDGEEKHEEMSTCDVSISKSLSLEKTKTLPHDVLDIDDEEDEEESLTSQNKSRSMKGQKMETLASDSGPVEGKSSKKTVKLSVDEMGKGGKESTDSKKSLKRKGEELDEDEPVDLDQSKGEVIEMSQTSEKTTKKKRKKRKKNQKSTETESPKVMKPVKDITLKPSAQEAIDKIEDQDEDEEDGMRVTMEELFQDEDVVEQFAKDKMELEEQKRPKKEDPRLPGWGHWSGPDYKDKPQLPKRRKKFTKADIKPKSAKEDKPNVWLNPNRNDAIRKLQPKKVPFPYTSCGQYEASMRYPVSRGFVRETAYKALNKPQVVTKLGHIIKPLDKDDFFKEKELEDDEEFGKHDTKDKQHSGPIKFWNNRKSVK